MRGDPRNLISVMRAEGSGTLIAEIQVLPTPAGTADKHWSNVDAAIAVLTRRGLDHEVGPLGTSIAGDPDAVWDALRSAHEATLAHGATSVVSIIKVYQSTDGTPTMGDLTAPHRPPRD